MAHTLKSLKKLLDRVAYGYEPNNRSLIIDELFISIDRETPTDIEILALSDRYGFLELEMVERQSVNSLRHLRVRYKKVYCKDGKFLDRGLVIFLKNKIQYRSEYRGITEVK